MAKQGTQAQGKVAWSPPHPSPEHWRRVWVVHDGRVARVLVSTSVGKDGRDVYTTQVAPDWLSLPSGLMLRDEYVFTSRQEAYAAARSWANGWLEASAGHVTALALMEGMDDDEIDGLKLTPCKCHICWGERT